MGLFDRGDLGSLLNVPAPEGLIPRAGGELLAVGIPGDRVDLRGVSREGLQGFGDHRLPDLDRLVVGRRDDRDVIGQDRDAEDRAGVSFEVAGFELRRVGRGQVERLTPVVEQAGGDLLVVGRRGQGNHAVGEGLRGDD